MVQRLPVLYFSLLFTSFTFRIFRDCIHRLSFLVLHFPFSFLLSQPVLLLGMQQACDNERSNTLSLLTRNCLNSEFFFQTRAFDVCFCRELIAGRSVACRIPYRGRLSGDFV